MSYLSKQLTDSQKQAIHHDFGPMLVLAGPGSGKTYVIAKRLTRLMNERVARPEELLVLTFTKEAALEMKRRTIQEHPDANQIVFGTFHSVFYQILKSHPKYRNYKIIQSKQIQSITKKCAYELGIKESYLEEDWSHYYDAFTDYHGNKNQFHVKEQDGYEILLKSYYKSLEQQKMLDFESILFRCKELLLMNPDLLEHYQNRFQFVLIDEFQDINPLQYEIIRLLVEKHGNLQVVGDDDQAIYSFRGGCPEIFTQFAKDYKNYKRISLDMNFRSKSDIVSISRVCIKHNKIRLPKSPKAYQVELGEVNFIEEVTKENQYKEIIQYLLKPDNRQKWEDTAILFRLNAKQGEFIEQLEKNNIPYYNQKKNINIANQDKAIVVLEHILQFMLRESTRTHLLGFIHSIYIQSELQEWIGNSMYEECVKLDELKKYYKNHREVLNALRKLERDSVIMKSMDLFGCTHYIFYSMGLLKVHPLDDEYVKWVLEMAKRTKEVDEFVSYLQSICKRDDKAKEVSGIKIMSYHASKGLEFESVILPDLLEGIVPHKKAHKQCDLEEERRMFYVALTRAKSKLLFATIKENSSRFYRELQ